MNRRPPRSKRVYYKLVNERDSSSLWPAIHCKKPPFFNPPGPTTGAISKIWRKNWVAVIGHGDDLKDSTPGARALRNAPREEKSQGNTT